MRTLTSIDERRRWSVTALGTLLCGVIVSTIIVTHIEWTMVHYLQFAIPILLALGLTAYGGWLCRSELSTERIPRIAMWSLAGIVVISSFATWEMFIHLIEGEPFIASLHELLLGGTEGAIVGGLIGYYDAQRLEQHQETERAQQAISASIDGIAILNEDERYTDVNQAHADLYGYEGPEDFIGETWRMCYSEAELPTIEETVMPALEAEGEWRGELTGQRRDGTQFTQEITLSTHDDGGPVCIVRDITERKQREQELERHRDLFEQTQRIAHIGGWEFDLVDDELQWTDEVYRIHELPLDYEPTVEEALDYFHPEDAPVLEAAFEKAIEHGEDYDLEVRLITANDTLKWVRARGETRQTGDETVMIRGTFQDITERKEREQELHSTSNLLSSLVGNIPAGILAEDSARQVLHTNQEFTELFGIETAPDDLVGSDCEAASERVKDLFVESERFIDSTNEATTDESSIRREEFELVDGRTFERSGTPVQLEDEKAGYLWVYHDITERKRRVQALEEAEGRFRALTDNAEFGVITIDETSSIQYANNALEEVLGYRPEELEGESITTLMPERFRDDHHGGIQRYLRDGTRNLDWDWIELPGLHRDGHEVPLGISFGETQLEDGPLFTGILRDITEQTERENQIASLHEASRQLMYASTPDEVASMTVEIADQILDKPLSAMWLYDQETNQLRPTATAKSSQEFLEAAGVTELSPIGDGKFGMDVFQDGERALIENYDTIENPTYPDLSLGTVFVIPIENHGILGIGADSLVEVTDTERHQIEILTLNARAALDRVQREQYVSRLIDNLPGMVYRATNEPEWPMEFVRGTCRELTGYDSTTIQEGAVTFGEDIIHPDDQQVVWETVQDALEADERFEIEYRIQTKDDTVKWVWEQGTGVYGEQGQLVALEGFIMDITDRKEFAEMIETLHSATRDMVEMEDTEQVCNTAVETADRLLNLPITAIWLSDDTGRRLDPVAQSEEGDRVIDELPVYTAAEESLSWQAFESEETQVYDNLQTEASLANTETPIQSEIIVPLGDYGVMNVGSQTAHSFDETDVRAAELLGANTTTALERVEREQELETQLDRMEFFNSILRHDVLNGMTVIQGRAEFLTDELDGDQLRDADAILNWSDDIIEIVQRVRTTLDTLTDESDIQLQSVDLSRTLREELDRVRETYPQVTFETTIPNSVHVQATELLGEVFGNIITNAVNHNETDGLCVSITATEQEVDNTATVRIADNGKGVADESTEAIFRRENTGHAKSSGSGFGLFFVDTMLEKYDGDVWVEDNEAGGATFVIELPLAKATTPV